MKEVVIVGGATTAKEFHKANLGSVAIKGSFERAGVIPELAEAIVP